MVSVLRRWVMGGLVAAALLVALPAWAVPEIQHPVNDMANVLSPEAEVAIASRLVAHRQATGVQMAVLLVASTDGVPIEDFSHEVAVHWGGGSRGQDNGVLFTLAVRDRRSRLEVGYGLEAAITDGEARRILDSVRPELRALDYAAAVRRVVEQVIAETGGASAVQLAAGVQAGTTPGSAPAPEPGTRVVPSPHGRTVPRAQPSHPGNGMLDWAARVLCGVFCAGVVVLIVWFMFYEAAVTPAHTYASSGVSHSSSRRRRSKRWSKRRNSFETSSGAASSTTSSRSSSSATSDSRSSTSYSSSHGSSWSRGGGDFGGGGSSWSGGGGDFGGGGASSSW
jgi:uncharacterized membrane protein YgcG